MPKYKEESDDSSDDSDYDPDETEVPGKSICWKRERWFCVILEVQ